MADISELQTRLSRALDRVAAGLERLAPDPDAKGEAADPLVRAQSEIARLTEEIEGERDASAQLRERIRASRERHDARVAEVEAELARAQAILAATEEDRGRLKALVTQLTETCEGLHQSAADGGATGAEVNAAMAIELEALRTLRQSDRAEIDAILRLLGEEADADA